MKKVVIFFVLGFFCSFSGIFSSQASVLSQEDQVYLKKIMQETWACISDLVDEKSGIPFDSSAKPNYTSMSNIGFYLASIFGAQEAGLINQKEAEVQIKKVLDFLDRLEKWRGFPPSWLQVYQPISLEKIISPVDSANLVAGLLVIRQGYPIFKDQITKLINAMDWKAFYDNKANSLKGGYNLRKKRELSFQYKDLGTELRMAFFLTIATKAAPLKLWTELDKILEERYDIQYLGPGWKNGGLFLQGMTGLFLDERGTMMGKSFVNMAYAQILHAKQKKYPFWGWSACSTPDGGYLGAGKVMDQVVTPHASVLAISYYPQQVVKNLKQLDLYKIRKPFYSNHGPKNYGFRDAIDLKSKKVTERYLMIDQTMIFLSLVNFLHEGVIYKTFSRDPIVKQGLDLISDYKNSFLREVEEICQKRDKGLEEKIPLELDLSNPIIKPFVESVYVETVAKHVKQKVMIDGHLSEWSEAKAETFPLSRTLESGLVQNTQDLDAKAYFLWDEKYLFFAIEVMDDEIINDEEAKNLFKGDCIELFIDPDNDVLKWGSLQDFQIGFSAPTKNQTAKIWAWFQSRAPKSNEIQFGVSSFDEARRKGYRVEAAIAWKFLKVEPKAGRILGISPAVHDIDLDQSAETKLNWCYLSEGKLGGLKLEQ